MNDFAKHLLKWFDRHRRENLPWRAPSRARDAYAVWVAEIMLQQTQVATVAAYYENFLSRFPDIKTLAAASADEVMHHFAGLGYYARARNLHAAAKHIMREHAGSFPQAFADILALPGVGRSTAGAIAAFAFNQRRPILDGNVKRVLARHFAVAGDPSSAATQKMLWQLADDLTPKARVADYTQAMMDFGAGVCVRDKPRCDVCPFAASCRARELGRVADFPARKRRAPRPTREVLMPLILDAKARVLLQQRPPRGVWGGLWSPPEIDADAVRQPDFCIGRWCAHQFGVEIELVQNLPTLKHAFTHFDLHIRPLVVRAANRPPAEMRVKDDARMWFDPAKPARIGLPAPIRRLLENGMPPDKLRRGAPA